jgi:predicted O-linked N-acetylglucosamine transferase (SPINDLY family)
MADARLLALARQHAEACLLQGRFAEAAEGYRRALQLGPNPAEVHTNLGVALARLGRLEEAAASYRRAVELRPDYAEAHSNLGNALQGQGKLEEAVASYRRALQLRPGYAKAHTNLGSALQKQGKLEEAAASHRRALQLRPDFAGAHNNLGSALAELGRPAEAAACCRRAVELRPDYAGAHNNLGSVLVDLGRLEEAAACHRRAVELQPDFADAHTNLGYALGEQGQIEEAITCYRRALHLKPDDPRVHSNLLFLLYFHPGYDARTIYAEHLHWNQRYAGPLAKSSPPHPNDRSPDRRLRIGYVSPDFRDHVDSYFTVPLLSNHDHGRFEIFCYAQVARPDAVTERLRGYADVWRDIVGLTDPQVADLVRHDRIDILVDLKLHTADNRLLVFARKPAPVQVAWLSYPGTTGLSAMDYRLTDPYLDPPGLFDDAYSEESLRLPDTFWCYDPLTDRPPVNPLPALGSGGITFGCLNTFRKVNDGCLALWAGALRAVPGSRLLMTAPPGPARDRALAVLEREGVVAARVAFVDKRPRPEYLGLYHRIDLCLDTLPYNGGTTSLDALWMGVPTLTMPGRTAVGRAGVCLLQNLGLPELIAAGPEDFARIAAEWAADLPRLSQLRATLRDRLEDSPLMDAPRFARNVEAACRLMWQRWCAR